jgi:hypothetical protein
MMMNPAGTLMSTMKDIFSVKSLQTVLYGFGGFAGALGIPQFFLSQTTWWAQPVVRTLAPVVTTGILATLAWYALGDRDAVRTVVTGGLVASGWRAVSEVVPASQKASFPIPLLAGLGDAQSDAFRRAIEGEIVRQLQSEGLSAYATVDEIRRLGMNGMGAYATVSDMTRAADGQSGFHGLPQPRTLMPSGVGFADEFDPKTMRERF